MKYFSASVVLLLLLSFLPVVSLFQPGLPVAHDAQDHVVRIANFYQSFSEGNLVPRWGGNLNWGFGHPVVMFLYPFPSYIAVVLRTIGFSFVDSTKIIFGLAYIVSIAVFYAWARRQWGNWAGFAGAIAYGFAPYRFVDMYVRGALGEHVAFIFPPLILLGLWLSAHKKSTRFVQFLCIAGGVGGLVLSHNAVSLMLLPVAVLYAVYLAQHHAQTPRKYLAWVFLAMMSGMALSSFFWIPALIEGKYTLRYIVTAGEVLQRFVPLQQLFYSAWNYGGGNEFSKQVGIVQWVSIAAVLALLRHPAAKRQATRQLMIGIVAIFGFSLWMTTVWSRILWEHIPLLQTFQFPWRFLTLTVFVAAAAVAQSLSLLAVKPLRVGVFGVTVILLLSTVLMWHPKAYKVYDAKFFSSVYQGTTDTGESSPIWSVRFMERTPPGPLELIAGEASYEQRERSTTVREYRVVVRSKSRWVENTLYFPGWVLMVNGQQTEIQFQDPDYRGLMTFWLEPGEHTVRFIFTDTKVRRLANMISIISGIAVLIWFGKRLLL